MKLDKYDRLFVVPAADPSIILMDVEDLVNHVNGGMDLNGVAIFTTSEEAEYYVRQLQMVARDGDSAGVGVGGFGGGCGFFGGAGAVFAG